MGRSALGTGDLEKLPFYVERERILARVKGLDIHECVRDLEIRLLRRDPSLLMGAIGLEPLARSDLQLWMTILGPHLPECNITLTLRRILSQIHYVISGPVKIGFLAQDGFKGRLQLLDLMVDGVEFPEKPEALLRTCLIAMREQTAPSNTARPFNN